MEDINALNHKLQSISKSLESFQGAVIVQEEKIRKCNKEKVETKELKDSLQQCIGEIDRSTNILAESSENAFDTTASLKLELDLIEGGLNHIPAMIRKVCTDYGRISLKNGKMIDSLRKSLLRNAFWSKEQQDAQSDCALFKIILGEAMYSQEEFASSEQERLRSVLEMEETKLAYLNECLKEAAWTQRPALRSLPQTSQQTPQQTPQVVCAPTSAPPKMTFTSPAVRVARQTVNALPQEANPFGDWADRSSPRSSDAPLTSSKASSARGGDTITGYKFCYPVRTQADDGDAGAAEGESEGESEGEGGAMDVVEAEGGPGTNPAGTVHPQRGAGTMQMTISTTTVTERIVRTTAHSASYNTDKRHCQEPPYTSAFLRTDDHDYSGIDEPPPAPPTAGAGRGGAGEQWRQEAGPVNDGPLASFQGPAVPWFRELKRRRVSAPPDFWNPDQHQHQQQLPPQWSPAPASALMTWPEDAISAPVLRKAPSTGEARERRGGASQAAQRDVVGRGKEEWASPAATHLQQPAVVDLYDTSGSEEEHPQSAGAPPLRQGSSSTTGGQVAPSPSPSAAWAQPGTRVTSVSHTKGRGAPWKERFRTGLDLVNASIQSID